MSKRYWAVISNDIEKVNLVFSKVSNIYKDDIVRESRSKNGRFVEMSNGIILRHLYVTPNIKGYRYDKVFVDTKLCSALVDEFIIPYCTTGIKGINWI